jgi:hypothetical protein
MGRNHGEVHLTLREGRFDCALLPGGSTVTALSSSSPCSASFAFADGFDERYSSSATLFGNKVRVFWQWNLETGGVRFGVRSLASATTLALGFGTRMVGSTAFVAWTTHAAAAAAADKSHNVYAYHMTSQQAKGFEVLLTTDDIGDAAVYETQLPGGGSALSFEFKLDGAAARETFGLDLLRSPQVDLIWSYGNSWNALPEEADVHLDRSSSATTVDLATGSARHAVGASASFVSHGVLMWVTWCVLIPIVLVAARYVRMLPKSSFLGQVWVNTHKRVAYVATVLALSGTVVVVVHLDDVGSLHLRSTHAQLGVACMVFLGAQVALGIFRPPPNVKPAAAAVCNVELELTDVSSQGSIASSAGYVVV